MKHLRKLFASVVVLLLCSLVAWATSDPVGYYPADDNGNDLSPSQHNATITSAGISSYEAGKIGQAFSFDGVNQYVDFGTWFSQQSFTIGFWIKDQASAGTPQAEGAMVLSQKNFHTGTNYFQITYTASNGGQYVVATNNGGASISFSITQGVWHYLLLTRNGLALRVFLDGALQGSSTGSTNDNLNFTGNLRAGADSSLGSHWKGALDEVRFYDRALTDGEIAQLASTGSGQPVAAVYPFSAPDQSLDNTDGSTPETQLLAGPNGEFFGTARAGGPAGKGTVYKLSSAGDFTRLHGFDGATGSSPNGVLASAPDDGIYGSTGNGGDANSGTLFRTDSAGDFVSLYSFTAVSGVDNTNADGRVPQGGLVRATDGAFYGLTSEGGAFGQGTIFKMTTDGTQVGTTVTPLYSFPAGAGAPGHGVATALFLKSDGSFLGITAAGGTSGNGSLFRMTTDGTAGGTIVTALRAWTTDELGNDLGDTAFTAAAGGVVYGLRNEGGANGSGFLFKVGPDNSYTFLYSFPSATAGGNAGGNPQGGLILESAGTLLGTSSEGGVNGVGTIFRITTDGTSAGTSAALLYSFTAVDSNTDVNSEGATPFGTLLRSSTGLYYGATIHGGVNGQGTIYSFDPSSVVQGPTFGVSDLVATGPSAPGGPIHFTASATTGARVEIQATTTPEVPSSWKLLYDFDEGRMTESGGTPGRFTLDSAAYPDGAAVSFRAVANAPSQTEAISHVVGPFALHQAQLAISSHITSTSDPQNGTVSHVGDLVTLSFTVENKGSINAKSLKIAAIIPAYSANDNRHIQFGKTDITKKSSGGLYVAATSTANPNAQVAWPVGNLDAGSAATVNYTIKLPNSVRLDPHQNISTGGYTVFSTANPAAPSFVVSGDSSGSPLLTTSVESPLAYSLTAGSATVAPGGLFTYHYSITNLSSVAVAYPVAVIDVPTSARFATSYVTGSKTSVLGVVYTGKKTGPPVKVSWFTGGLEQVIVSTVGLKPHGDKSHGDTVAFDVTFQALWVDPTQVPTLESASGRVAFLSATSHAILAAAFKNQLGASKNTPSTTDFKALIATAFDNLAITLIPSGGLHLPIQGSTDNAPRIVFSKAIANGASATLNDGLGDVADLVVPGDTVTYTFVIANEGKSPAESVYLQDAMPDHTSYVPKSAKILSTTASSKMSDLSVVPEVNGRHLIFDGLHLEARDVIILTYSVTVDTSAATLPIGTLLTTASGTDPDTGLPVTSSVGSDTSPHTVGGLTLNGPLQLGGKVSFAQPRIRPMIPKPEISPDPATTRDALRAAYASDPDAKPLTNAADPLSFIPGMDRFYIHYENTSPGVVANVDLTVPLPANALFYRANFVTLTPNPLPGADGIWPGKIAKNPAGAVLTPPALLTQGSVSVHFASLAKGAKGDLMVEVIVSPNAVQPGGSFLCKDTDAPVVIHDNPVAHGATPPLPQQSAQNKFPNLHVAHRAAPIAGAASARSFQPQITMPTVPEIGVLKTAPIVVNSQGLIEYTFAIFNSGDTDSPACTFTFLQPANTDYLTETYTSLYGAQFGTSNQNPVPGTTFTWSWDYIPAHSAVAVTIGFTASGPSGTPVTDLADRVTMPYLGTLGITPTATGVIAAGTSSPSLSNLGSSITGHPLHEFSVQSVPILIVELGAGNMLVEEPRPMYSELTSGSIQISIGSRGVFVGSGTAIGVGATSADNLVNNRNHGAILQGFDTSPATTVVPADCLALALAGQVAAAAGSGVLELPTGAKLITQDGGGIISHDGGGIISHDGGGIISHDGGGIISHDGGGIISHDGGGIISHDGGGITAQQNTALISTSGGSVTSQSGGSIISHDGGG